jgi:plastocyanin
MYCNTESGEGGVMPVIQMTNQGYKDKELKVKQGDRVWWLNEDTRPHSAKSDDKTTFDTYELNEGEAASRGVNHAPGRIPYHDEYSNFRGVLIVE